MKRLFIIFLLVNLIAFSIPVFSNPQEDLHAFLLGVVDSPPHDHWSLYGPVSRSLMRMGYEESNIIIEAPASVPPQECLDQMSKSDISVLRGHGGFEEDAAGNISSSYMLVNPEDADNQLLYSTSIENSPLDFSDGNLFVFAGCRTAPGGASPGVNNLITASVSRGVETAIGFDMLVDCMGVNLWTEKLFEFLSFGETVERACRAATIVALREFPNSRVASYRIAGNSLQTFMN